MFNRRKPEDVKSTETTPGEERSALSRAGIRTSDSEARKDNGLDVPPFRPAHQDITYNSPSNNEETLMARPPFSSPIPPSPSTILRPPGTGVQSAADTSPRLAGERRTLVVGRGISVQGTVQDAERLVVEGTVEAAMINGLAELVIAPGGVFKGEVEVDEAEVSGTIDGTLTARNALIIRATGRVLGTARCRRLQVEDGGQMTGRIEMLNEAPSSMPILAKSEAE